MAAHTIPPRDELTGPEVRPLAAASSDVSWHDQLTTPEQRAVSSDPASPRTFGRYEDLEEVAHGGMGVVFRARDSILGRTVALKTIRSGLLAGAEDTERFLREAQAAALLGHPNIVSVYEIGEHEGQPYFTMAFAANGCLTQHLDAYRADPTAAVTMLEKIARAIHCAHQNGILHRDLKPANILLDDRGEPLVSDFGLAKFMDASKELTRPGEVLGTPSYMAPEQTSGLGGKVGPATDVWALGVILYELLTGRRPFEGRGRDEVTQLIRTTHPPRPRSLCRTLDRNLERIVLHCLEKEPGHRYATAEALADDLGRWLRGEPVLGCHLPLPVRAWRSLHRRPWRSAALVLVLVGAVAAAAFTLLSDPDRELKPIEARLARGEAVPLIGASGPPAWSKWVLGEADAKTSSKADQPFSVQSWDVGLLELVRDPGHDRFRISAEIAHRESSRNGEVGLYFARNVPKTKQSKLTAYGALTFHDVDTGLRPADEPIAPRGRVELRLEAHHQYARDRSGLFRVTSDVKKTFPLTGKALEPVYRSLAIEVTPEKYVVYWEKERLGEWSRERWTSRMAVWQTPMVDPDFVMPEFAPRLPLGLYVKNSSALVRSVAVEPLAEKP